MKSDNIFFMNDWSIDQIMKEIGDLECPFKRYKFILEIENAGWFPEVEMAMIARARINKIWNLISEEQQKEVRKIDIVVLQSKGRYINNSPDFSESEVEEFIDWLERAVKREDEIL